MIHLVGDDEQIGCGHGVEILVGDFLKRRNLLQRLGGIKSYIIRYAATDNTFSSKLAFYTPYAVGDVNMNGKVDAVDASNVLSYYASISIGKEGSFSNEQLELAVFDDNGKIDAVDASKILSLYAARSVSAEQ